MEVWRSATYSKVQKLASAVKARSEEFTLQWLCDLTCSVRLCDARPPECHKNKPSALSSG